MRELEGRQERGELRRLSKREGLRKELELSRLQKYFRGLRDMKKPPSALFVIDIEKERIAVEEGRKARIPIFALVDSNCDPDLVDHVIPGTNENRFNWKKLQLYQPKRSTPANSLLSVLTRITRIWLLRKT